MACSGALASVPVDGAKQLEIVQPRLGCLDCEDCCGTGCDVCCCCIPIPIKCVVM